MADRLEREIEMVLGLAEDVTLNGTMQLVITDQATYGRVPSNLGSWVDGYEKDQTFWKNKGRSRRRSDKRTSNQGLALLMVKKEDPEMPK